MEIVEEQNPLHVSVKQKFIQPATNKNCAGRPKKINEIKFSPQPKSIVSLLLNAEKKAQENKQLQKDLDKKYECTAISNEPESNKRVEPEKNKMYHCTYLTCKYTSKSSSNLIKHKRRHTAEKPYMCDQCTFRTNFINSLTVHKRIHSGEKPFICEHCCYRCNSSSNLKKHLMHKHSGIT